MDLRADGARRPGAPRNALQRAGVELGDYVSVWMPDRRRRRCARGSARTPPEPSTRRSTSPRAGRTSSTRCNLAESKVLVAHHRARRPPRGPRRCRTSSTVVLVGGEPRSSCRWPTVTLDELLDGVADERPALPRPVEPWDDLSLIYTSGTTGPSKGVRASHAAFWNYANCFILPFVDESDRYLQPLPMFHTAGTGITYSMLRAGGSVALSKGFSARTFWDDVRRFEATITIAIHGMVTFMLDQPRAPRRRRQPAARRSTWARSRGTRSSRSASAVRDLHGVRDDRGAGADRLGARPGRRAQLRRERADPERLRAAARRRERRAGAGGHPRRARRPARAAVDDQLRLQEHARGDGEGVAERLVPHGRPVHPGRGRGTSTSSTGSRT